MFISKDQQEKIKRLNHILGMKHRSQPFDFNKKEDWIEALEMITAEYIDFCEYWGRLSDLNSSLDESLECFYPANWMEITQDGQISDDELDEAVRSVNQAENALQILMDRAEEKCKEIWQLTFDTRQDAVIKYFLGEEVTYKSEDLKHILEDYIFELATEIEYNGNVQHSVQEFSKNLKRKMESKRLDQ